MELENTNTEKKVRDANGYLAGFVIAIVAIVIFPMIIFGGVVSVLYIQMTSLIAVVVIPLTSILLSMATRNSFTDKTLAGMNLGNAFSIGVLYVLAKTHNIELSRHDVNIFIYGLIASLVVALLIHMLDRRRKGKVAKTSPKIDAMKAEQ